MRFPQTFSSAATDMSQRRKVDACAIDSPSTRFREDAISISLTEDGNYRVCVSVVDMLNIISAQNYEVITSMLSVNDKDKSRYSFFQSLRKDKQIGFIEAKRQATLNLQKYRPTLTVSFEIDAITGDLSHPDVFLSATKLLEVHDNETASKLIPIAPENHFFDLLTLAAETYLSSRPNLSKITAGGCISSIYNKMLLTAGCHALGLYGQINNVPLIFGALGLNSIFSYAAKPIDDPETSSTARAQFTSPFRLMGHFVNVLQISAHLAGNEYPFETQEIAQIVSFLNRKRSAFGRAPFDIALSASKLPVSRSDLPFQ